MVKPVARLCGSARPLLTALLTVPLTALLTVPLTAILTVNRDDATAVLSRARSVGFLYRLIVCFAAIPLCYSPNALWANDAVDKAVIGLVAERPAQGHFVETDRGFMVSYTEQIPGTNVRVAMVPVPGGRLAVMPDFSTRRRVNHSDPKSVPNHVVGASKPSHFVTIAPFWIGKYEVTWGEFEPYSGLYPIFREFDDHNFRTWNQLAGADAVTVPTELYAPDYHFFGKSKLPVAGVTQFSARQYTKWLSRLTERQYRLPAEAEWEYACRGGTTTQFSWGDDFSQVAEYAVAFSAGRHRPEEAGTLRPNPWGLYNMHGNVAEWVLDAYSSEGIPKSSGGELVDLVRWPKAIHPRVARGGWWQTDAHGCRTVARMGSTTTWSESDPGDPVSPWWHCDVPAQGLGFRIVRSLDTLPQNVLDRVWNPDCEELTKAITLCHQDGRAGIGRVDRDLPDVVRRYRELKE